MPFFLVANPFPRDSLYSQSLAPCAMAIGLGLLMRSLPLALLPQPICDRVACFGSTQSSQLHILYRRTPARPYDTVR